MDGFVRYSSSALLVLAFAVGGCVEDKPGPMGTTSLRIELTSPTDTGTVDMRLPDDQRTLTFDVTALDEKGELDPTLSGPVDVYAQFLGSLTPPKNRGIPLEVVNLVDGVATDVTLDLPQAFGPTFLWVEHVQGDDATYATGTTPTLWYRNAWISDISTPRDEGALDALESSPLEQKQVVVNTSRYGDAGRMVITGVYAQGYTLSDVSCADAAATPPCVPGPYDHIFVFTFSRPEDQDHRGLQVGQIVSEFSGAVSEFNGLTEIGFPQTFLASPDVEAAVVPEPVVIQSSWLSTRIEMERVEAALVAVDGATLCPLDDEWDTFKQWKLDIGLGCGNPINVISSGQVPDFDPAVHVGEVLPRVVGTLRPVNIGSFHVWIIFPRVLSDITLP